MAREEVAEGTVHRPTSPPAPPPAQRPSGRDWVLATCLLLVANYSVLTVLDSWLEAWDGVLPVRYALRTVGFRLLMVVAGACVRPRSIGAMIAATALVWLLLDVLSWAGVFNIYTLFAPKPRLYFEF